MRYRPELTVARVDKPLREEAAGSGCGLWGKRAAGWFCDCDGRVGLGDEDGCCHALPEDLAWV